MEDHQRLANIVRLARRVPLAEAAAEDIDNIASILKMAVPDRVIMGRSSTTTSSTSSSTCAADNNAPDCEKPVGPSSYTLPVILCIVIPVAGAIILFTYLQRRYMKKAKEEDANDPTKNMDFGMGRISRTAGGESSISNFDDEKGGPARTRQMSLDLGGKSPYLLPPELQDSRESLHSLSKTIHQNEDPYRPVHEVVGAASVRSKQGRNGSSILSASTVAPSGINDTGSTDGQGLLSNAAAMSRTTPPTAGSNPPPRSNSIPPAKIPEGPRQATSPGQNVDKKGPPGSLIVSGPSAAAPTGPLEPKPTTTRKAPPPAINTLPPMDPKPEQPRPRQSEISDYGDGIEVTPPSPVRIKINNKANRYSMDVPPEEFAQAGLGAPGFDPKRLSMGFRPLPPDAPADAAEDPETRANRIRSFYKEYFDDSKPAPQGQYIEDYNAHYPGPGDSTYFDPATNSFVLPYAEPIARRAMTPPPRATRFQGAPPRSMHGSMGGASIRGPPRMPFNEGPRASSSASQRGPMPSPKKNLPPPEALTSLPTPSKLKDDSFALLNTLDFAPELTTRDRVAGRSASPFGERRPYSPAVPAFAPIVGAFDELAAMPSPHMFRKSGTFTSLDFAPPRRFRDPENMSDAGSIRSNNSGISSVQANAIRNGAYRISKIPTDIVFTKDDMAATLKPEWGMRQGM
ncbi:3232c78b-54a5-4b01-832e-9994fdbc0922 [Sclerotinia trifoliorum]|uniref:3232c78b-54a5-4b01-832e-9994fdbc0922 n=1 Tax=Sclerotinia trifoliorum TaxID=28548 RepID=A0A8H2VMK4_9HELO|nr:3232c78b-54a5-4b01-832e-9994fdbc0922 [Sclerotinia trifoliorum]